MTVIFNLNPNRRHAAKERHGFLCFLGLDAVLPLAKTLPVAHQLCNQSLRTLISFPPHSSRRVGNLFAHDIAAISRVGKQPLPTLQRLPRLSTPIPTFPLSRGVGRDVAALNQKTANRCAGFTLLEMLVVIGLLAVVMLTTTSIMIDENAGEKQQQAKQDGTQTRWNQIRTAIIGDTNLTLSNPSMVSGYVADMGRLPANIKELLVKDVDHDSNPSTPNFVQPAWGEVSLSAVTDTGTVAVTGKLWGGWRGPYLYTAGSRYYGDAWGNININAPTPNDEINSGWYVTRLACTTVLACSGIAVQSLGEDGVLGGADFNADFPAAGLSLVSSTDWQISAASIGFNVVLNRAPLVSADQNLELRLYFIENGVTEEEISTRFIQLSSVVGITTHPVTINPIAPATTVSLPMGKYAAVIWCPTQKRVYAGDCASVAAATNLPYYFSLLASATLPITIPWNF